ncbi:MAG: cytochrome c oxidase subunit 2A [Candidatus Promineofilum sp.]|nr:cytochrome c oxidase subunit 2A [Promineifilum sp.]MCW5861700.1 cytochrome c oxidase subunit 2A [Anaerolineae bacterium]HOU39871.1 cytochrome c oxidase subunit 2A [Promineifilum sp.]
MNDKDRYKTPQGTIALMVIFIILIIALWGSAYLTLLSRGVTQ